MSNRILHIWLIAIVAAGTCLNTTGLAAYDTQQEAVNQNSQDGLSALYNELSGKEFSKGFQDITKLGFFMGVFDATRVVTGAVVSEVVKPAMGSLFLPFHLTRSWLETIFMGAQHFEHNELAKINNLIIKHVGTLQKGSPRNEQWLIKKNFLLTELNQTLETLKERSVYYGPQFKKRTITPLNWAGRIFMAIFSLEQRTEISKKLSNAILCLEDFLQKLATITTQKDFVEHTKDTWQLNLISSNIKDAATLIISNDSGKERFVEPNAPAATANFGGLDMFNQTAATA